MYIRVWLTFSGLPHPFSLDILLGKFQPVHGSYDFGAVFPSLQPIGVLV